MSCISWLFHSLIEGAGLPQDSLKDPLEISNSLKPRFSEKVSNLLCCTTALAFLKQAEIGRPDIDMRGTNNPSIPLLQSAALHQSPQSTPYLHLDITGHAITS